MKEYKIVIGYTVEISDTEKKLNFLAKEGFKVITTLLNSAQLIYTLEREI